MYLPIPEGVNVTQTLKVSTPATECAAAVTKYATASFSIPKSTTPLEKMNNSVHYEVYRPTEGSWREIKSSKKVKMTPMSIVNQTATHNLGQVKVPYEAHSAVVRTGDARVKINGVCKNCVRPVVYDVKVAKVQGSYVEQGDLSYWKSKYPDVPHYAMDMGYLDEDKIEAAKSEAYAELFQGFNLGEEIAELRETISGIHKLSLEAVDLILRSRKTITNLLKKDKVSEAGNRWMEFRYGIMPIIYSIQDLLSLKTEGLYRTTRKKVSPEIVLPEEVGDEPIYFQDIGVVDIRCAITAKGRWASEGLKNFDMININPLTTLTAVLPWAMVVRWFFNVQSYIDCRVKSLTSLALEHSACVAIREKREYVTYLHVTRGYAGSTIIDNGDSSCGAGFYGLTDFSIDPYYLVQTIPLSSYTVNDYRRYLYQPSDVKLVFNPHITWQRTIDALVLMMGSMSKSLRRLK